MFLEEKVFNLGARTYFWRCCKGIPEGNSTFCPHSAFMCFVWISEQTAFYSLYSVNWSVFNSDEKRLLRGTSWMRKYRSSSSLANVLPSFHPTPQPQERAGRAVYFSV